MKIILIKIKTINYNVHILRKCQGNFRSQNIQIMQKFNLENKNIIKLIQMRDTFLLINKSKVEMMGVEHFTFRNKQRSTLSQIVYLSIQAKIL